MVKKSTFQWPKSDVSDYESALGECSPSTALMNSIFGGHLVMCTKFVDGYSWFCLAPFGARTMLACATKRLGSCPWEKTNLTLTYIKLSDSM